MKRIFGIFGILLILFSSVFITPSLGMYVEEDLESLEFNENRLITIIADIDEIAIWVRYVVELTKFNY